MVLVGKLGTKSGALNPSDMKEEKPASSYVQIWNNCSWLTTIPLDMPKNLAGFLTVSVGFYVSHATSWDHNQLKWYYSSITDALFLTGICHYWGRCHDSTFSSREGLRVPGDS